MRLVLLLVLAVGGFFIWKMTQGSDVPDAPSPELPLPDSPDDAAGTAWDWADGAPSWMWTQVAPLALVGFGLWYMHRKMPKLFYTGLGILVGLLVIGAVLAK